MAKEKEKKMLVGLSWNCAAELKFLITALLFVCSLATVLQFLPSSPFSLSSSRLQDCIPNLTTTTAISSNSTAASNQTSSTTNTTAIDGAVAPANLSLLSPPPLSPPTTPPPLQQDEVLEGGIIKRSFNPYGAASYNFVLMSAYRGGLNTFAVMGLSSKPLHVYGHPSYQCHWVPQNSSSPTAVAAAYKVLPDWGYGHVYTVVVVNCTFPSPVGHDGSGGKLLLLASTNGGGDTKSNVTDTILALTEKPETLDPNRFSSPPKYDYLYCGSSLYGQLSPQRIREWLAYHVRLFGERSHFVIHDAGGIHPDVMEVFKPWMEKGYVTMQDIKEQERFDGYYHNQFLIVNDCLHRYKFDAKWMFFFDVDEFIFVPRKSNLKAVMDSLSEYTQFTIEQMTMSNKLCLSDDMGVSHKKWGFEKLVYRDAKRGIRRDRKYAAQPRNVFATGVHMSQNVAGKTTHKTEGRIMYFHYHGTIAERREPCQEFVNTTSLTSKDGIPYVVDNTMRRVAGNVKKFEFKMIGPRLKRTRQ